MTTKLRDARLRRGWSQTRLISELQTAAVQRGVALPDASVLKTQISRWENGRRAPDEFYQHLLQDAFDLTALELGFTSGVQPADSASDAIPSSKAVSPHLLGALHVSLTQLATLDAASGPGMVLALAREQARFAAGLMSGATGRERTDVLRVAARLSEFAGWLHQDAGDLGLDPGAANCYLRLGNHSEALSVLDQSIKAWPAGAQERDRGLALARLATAYAGAHEVEEAVTAGHASLKVLEVTRSARILTQIHDLRRELAPVWETPTVRDFNRAFKATTAWKA